MARWLKYSYKNRIYYHTLACSRILSYTLACSLILSHALAYFRMLSHTFACYRILSHALACFRMPFLSHTLVYPFFRMTTQFNTTARRCIIWVQYCKKLRPRNIKVVIFIYIYARHYYQGNPPKQSLQQLLAPLPPLWYGMGCRWWRWWCNYGNTYSKCKLKLLFKKLFFQYN